MTEMTTEAPTATEMTVEEKIGQAADQFLDAIGD